MANSSNTRDNGQKDRQPPIQAQANQPGRMPSDGAGQQGNPLGRNLPEGNQQGGGRYDNTQPSYQQEQRTPQGDPSQQSQRSPQQQGATAEKFKGKWQQQVGAAKVAWGKLTDDEILQTEGNSDKLAELVRERYAISQEAAEDQVKKFMTDNRY